MENFYALFNIEPTASKEDIKKKLNNLQRIWLGRTNAPNLSRRQEAEKMMQVLQEAEKILLDDGRKAEYDKQFASAGENQPKEEFHVDEKASVISLIQQADELIAHGRFADAIMVARRATELDGSNAHAWGVLAQANYQWNNVEDALYEYRKAIDLKPNEPQFYYDLGVIYYDDVKDVNKAMECARKCLQIDSKNFSGRYLYGFIQLHKGDFREALSVFEQLYKEAPDHFNIRKQLALAYEQMGFSHFYYQKSSNSYYVVKPETVEPAIKYFEKSIEVAPDEESKQFGRTNIQWARNSLKKQYRKMPFGGILTLVSGGLIISGLMGAGFAALMAGLGIGVFVGYFSYVPQWKINRKSLGV